LRVLGSKCISTVSSPSFTSIPLSCNFLSRLLETISISFVLNSMNSKKLESFKNLILELLAKKELGTSAKNRRCYTCNIPIITPFLGVPLICLAFFLALLAILLGYMAVQENQKTGGMASIVIGLVGIIWLCLIVYGLMSY